MEKRKFTIKIIYFKASGKCYATEEYRGDFEECSPGMCYMHDVIDWMKALRSAGKVMSGLSGCWDEGYIMLDCEEGFPCLLIPETA